MIRRRSLLAAIPALGFTVMTAGAARAQSYPSRPIKLVVPFLAGGTVDIVARIIGQQISAELGQPVVIDNRPGGGTTIALKAVATSDPDGYTLLLASTGSMVINPILYKKIEFPGLRDLVPGRPAGLDHQPVRGPLGAAGEEPSPNSSPMRRTTRASSITALRSACRRTCWANSSGRRPESRCPTFPTGARRRRSRISCPGRSRRPPKVCRSCCRTSRPEPRGRWWWPARACRSFPTCRRSTKSASPAIRRRCGWGSSRPGGTPAAIVDKLNAAINKGLKSPETQASYNKIGFQTRPGSVPEFVARIKGDTDGWASVINLTGVKVE